MEIHNKSSNALKSFLIILCLFLFSIDCFAEDSNFEINISNIDNDIYEDEIAEYKISIKNNALFSEKFEKPSTIEIGWIIYTQPPILEIPSGTVKDFIMKIDPKSTISPGTYKLQIPFRSTITKNYTIESFIVDIKSINQLLPEYHASIALNADIDYNIDPRNDIPINIYMRNRNSLIIDNLTVSINSDHFNKKETIPLSALEEFTKVYVFNIDKYTKPQSDMVNIKLMIGNTTINQKDIPINIKGFTEIKPVIETSSFFFKKITNIKLTNYGNIINKDQYSIPINTFENIFTSTVPKSKITIRDGKYLTFSKSLKPLESYQIRIVTNYRILIYGLLLIIIGTLLYFNIRSPILIKKEIIPIKEENESASEFKVRLLIMNRIKTSVENINVSEVVPKIVTVIKETLVGTIEPTKVIKHDKKGTLLKWEINYLEPYEERIITYKIKSNLGIVGSLILPKTKVTYETNTGKKKITYSKKESLKV